MPGKDGGAAAAATKKKSIHAMQSNHVTSLFVIRILTTFSMEIVSSCLSTSNLSNCKYQTCLDAFILLPSFLLVTHLK
jgi:hypothetical protein